MVSLKPSTGTFLKICGQAHSKIIPTVTKGMHLVLLFGELQHRPLHSIANCLVLILEKIFAQHYMSCIFVPFKVA
jgi:hypothetical protein